MTPLHLFTDRLSNTGLDSKKSLVCIALTFAGMAFLVSELMHYLFVPGLGRHTERMLAEGFSSLVVGLLASKLFSRTIERRRMTAVRLHVIEAINHQMRDSLDVISLSRPSISSPPLTTTNS